MSEHRPFSSMPEDCRVLASDDAAVHPASRPGNDSHFRKFKGTLNGHHHPCISLLIPSFRQRPCMRHMGASAILLLAGSPSIVTNRKAGSLGPNSIGHAKADVQALASYQMRKPHATRLGRLLLSITTVEQHYFKSRAMQTQGTKQKLKEVHRREVHRC